ncbi:MAG: ccmA [Hyphomicrobiales bacterium]|nr:ccmA [Hyphomicrobiales bacterium]
MRCLRETPGAILPVFPPSALLRVENLALARGGRRLTDDLSFEVRSGEALVVTGPNGAGKSTLLRALAGLLAPVSGRISFTAPGVSADDPPALCAHYLGHSDALKSALTARENLAFWSAALRVGTAGPGGLSPLEALEQVDLQHGADLPVGWLSAGQKRRVALARLFVARRPLWILDEPATALDGGSQLRLAAAMARHRAEGGLVVAATHAPLGLEGAGELRLGAP